MKAKHLKDLIKEFCEENSYAEDTEDLIHFYWTYVRKSLVAKTDYNLYVTGLGQFTMNRKKLARELAKNEEYLRTLDKKDYKGFEKYNDIEARVLKLRSLQLKIYDDIEKRNTFRKSQNETKN